MKIIHFYHFDSDPRFPLFLLYVRWKSGVTFVRRCFRDEVSSALIIISWLIYFTSVARKHKLEGVAFVSISVYVSRAKIKKNKVYPCKPLFFYITVGCKGV